MKIRWTRTRHRWEVPVLLSALFLAAAIRLAYLNDFHASLFFENPALDASEYLSWARQIQEGELLWNKVRIHSPLYAYALAGLLTLSDNNLGQARTVQALFLGIANTLILWLLARTCAGRLAGAVSAFLTASLWPLVFHDAAFLVESLVVLLNGLALLALMKSRGRFLYVGLAGTLLGISALARPNVLAFIPVAALWIAWHGSGPPEAVDGAKHRRRAASGAVLLCTCAAAVFLPAMALNHALSGSWAPQANGGLNFYIGNNPTADGTPNVRPGRPWDLLSALPASKGISDPEARERFYRAEALKWWREQPSKALRLFAKKIFLFWNAYETRSSQDIYYFRRLSPALSLPWPGFGVLAPLALVGMGLALAGRVRGTDLLLLYAATYTVATAAFVVSGRYRLPILCAAAPLAGLTVENMVGMLRHGERIRAGLCLLAVLLLGVLVRQVPSDVRVTNNADETYNLGITRMKQGTLFEAESLLRSAWKEDPSDGRIPMNLGAVLLRTGRTAESLPILQRAVELYPESSLGWTNLGGAYWTLGRIPEAEQAYRTALRLNPSGTVNLVNLGLLLYRSGNREEAVALLKKAEKRGDSLTPEASAVLKEERRQDRKASCLQKNQATYDACLQERQRDESECRNVYDDITRFCESL